MSKEKENKETYATYVWSVTLEAIGSSAVTSILVLCDESVPGSKFQKAIEDSFAMTYCRTGLGEKMPNTLDAYVVKEARNLGYGAGSVGVARQTGMRIETDLAKGSFVLDTERVTELAGLNDPEFERLEIERVKKEIHRKTIEKQRNEETRGDINNPLITMALLDTAVRIANGKDEQVAVPDVAIKEMLDAGAELKNKNVTFGEPSVIISDD